ncbi:hypothetical protein LJC64_02420 [Ruminococcaceae bacterium OttesenSCG-928-A11]|nr:hypothetical protein [Ruminococcaceae bacterium OttesenSCG-928-A11]
MAERLTGWDKDENGVRHAYVKRCFEGDGCPDMDTSKCAFCDDLIRTYDKLAAYEDSGLTPDEVKGLSCDTSAHQAGGNALYGCSPEAVRKGLQTMHHLHRKLP